MILGVGVGTLKEEFDLIGAPFDDRGPRADDALKALRASLSVRVPEYHGPFYDFEGLVVDPCAVQEHVPIWVGGRTLRSLRRAAALTDGWCPFAVAPAQAAEWLQQRRRFRPASRWCSRRPRVSTRSTNPEAPRRSWATPRRSGATIVLSGFASDSLAHYLEQLEALAAVHATV